MKKTYLPGDPGYPRRDSEWAGRQCLYVFACYSGYDPGAYPWVFDRDSDGEGGYNIPVRVFVDLKGEAPGGESQQLLTQVPEDYQVAELSVDTVQVVS